MSNPNIVVSQIPDVDMNILVYRVVDKEFGTVSYIVRGYGGDVAISTTAIPNMGLGNLSP